MNKNKIILAVIAWVVGFLVIIILMILSMNSDTQVKTANTLQVWTVGHEPEKFSALLKEYAEDVPTQSKTTFSHINFESFSDYQQALMYALANDEWPDIFMLSNSEQMFLQNATAWIAPSYVSPATFRKDYFPIFSELIATDIDEDKNETEYLSGVPAGFEVLWLYYDKRMYLWKNLNTWTNVGNAISDLKSKNSSSTPLALGDGTSVVNSSDILTQFMVHAWAWAAWDLQWSELRSVFADYQRYGGANGINGYKKNLETSEPKNSLNLFSEWDVSMIIGYPSTIKTIKNYGYSQNALEVTAYPKTLGAEDQLAARYNYFVIGRDSSYLDSASTFLAYLTTSEWAEEYYEQFTSVIPAKLEFVESLNERKIDPDYNVTPYDFLRDGMSFVSFDKWISSEFDARVPYILDDENGAFEEYQKLQMLINCKIWKIGTKTANNTSCN